MHRDMRFRKRQVKKKWLVAVSLNELNGLFHDQIGRIFFAQPISSFDCTVRLFGMTGNRAVVNRYLFVIVPKVGRKITVCNGLAVVTVKEIEALAMRRYSRKKPTAERGNP